FFHTNNVGKSLQVHHPGKIPSLKDKSRLTDFSLIVLIFRGTIQFQNVSYGIEPVEAMSGFVHVIYEITNNITEIPVLVENMGVELYDISRFQFGSNMKVEKFTKLLPRYLEMDIVVDKKLFDYMGSGTKDVIQKVIQVISLVNIMLSKLKLTVVINSIEIWSIENKISLSERPKNLLEDFLEWKKYHKPQHISYLFLFDEHPASTGVVIPGELCKMDFDAAVALKKTFYLLICLFVYSVLMQRIPTIALLSPHIPLEKAGLLRTTTEHIIT
ncbi:disintegrin and metalloproteinase domain-containing protein 5-like, partial [Sigmodon hispidus]